MTAAVKINDDQKSRLRRAIEQLEMDGPVTPGRLVELARDERSGIHDCFEWRDAVAAQRFRMHQARAYIRTVRIRVERVEAESRRLRVVQAPAPTPANDLEESVPGHEPLAAPPARKVEDIMVASAKADLKSFHRRFQSLRMNPDLRGVFVAIERACGMERPRPERGDGCENLVSRGLVKPGKKVNPPEVLRRENLPMRPPGR